MPSSTNPSQPTPIVQTIFDSVTRCFNPIDGEDESPFSSRCGYPSSRCPTSGRHAQESSTAGTTTNKNYQSRRTSSGGASQDAANKAYDADRYLERKLEIFRTTDEDCLAEFGFHRPRPSKRQKSSSGKHRRGDSSNTLVYASESDEITNLTKAQRRAEAQNVNTNNHRRGGNGNNENYSNNPVAFFIKLLRDPFNCMNEVQKQPIVGMCFATPVRTSSPEDISNLSDWKLTAEEFASRQLAQQHQGQGGQDAVPDVDESSASHSDQENEGEEETITSASYFDQKYPVTFDANPPMPLFQEHRVAVSEYETNEILKIVEQREENNVKKSISSSATSTTTSNRSSPTNHVIVKKNMRSASKSRLRRSAAANIQQNKRKAKYYDSSVVPLGKSSSVSTVVYYVLVVSSRLLLQKYRR